MEWTVGKVRISSLLELLAEVPAEMLIEAVSPESVAPYLTWLQPDYLTEDFAMKVAIQSMLIESDGMKILVDTCFGNDRELPYPNVPVLHTDFLDRLTGSGFAPADVDIVLCTHLHYDHVGWNTMLVDGKWQPTFPNARYLFGASEYEFWQDHEDFNIGLEDSIDPIVAAGLHELVPMDFAVTPEVRLVPTPGHTPGHVSVRIDSDGCEALVSGDMVHHPIQIVEQAWPSAPDYDPDRAVATRQQALAALANTEVLLIGTHFASPSAGHVRHDDSGWHWEPAPTAGSHAR